MAHNGVAILKKCAHRIVIVSVMALLLIGAGPFFPHQAFGAQLTNRSMRLSSNKPGEHDVSFVVAFTSPSSNIQSFKIEFCSNSALIEDTCVAPWGFDALNSNLTGQTGTSGFAKSPASGVNEIILYNPGLGTANAGNLTFSFDDTVNPTSAESYYVKISTYLNNSASGVPQDFGALAFSIIDGFDVSAEVPPYLTFCQGVVIDNFDCSTANGDQIGLGALASDRSSTATSKVMAATNAQSGYSIFANGFTMTSGNNVIPPMNSTTSAVGTSQFGINLRANTNPVVGTNVSGPGTGTVAPLYTQLNRFRFVNGEQLATATAAQDYRKYTISYVVNVNKDQAPGVYSTTLTYVCVANF